MYSFVEHQRTKETQYLYGASVIILEGLFILSDPELRKLIDMKVFGKLAVSHLSCATVYFLTPSSSASGLGSDVGKADTAGHY